MIVLHSLEVIAVIPTKLDVLVNVFTVAMYAMFSTKQFPFNGHPFFTLQ